MTKRRVFGLALLAVSLCLVSWSIHASTTNPPRVLWEYKVEGEFSMSVHGIIQSKSAKELSDEDTQLEAALNLIGSQGWELLTIEHDKSGTARYIFRRTK